MDMETKRDMETMAEWASTMDAYDRLLERRARRAKFVHRFRYFIPWPVAIIDDPVAAVPTSDSAPSADTHHRASASGVGTGVAGSRDETPLLAPNPGGVGESPRRPHHLPCSEASRISAALNRHT